MMQRRYLVGPLLLLTLMFVLKPGFAQSDSSHSAEALKTRANAYWSDKVHNQWEKAYKYEDPATVKNVNLSDYIRSVGDSAQWLGAKVKTVHIKGAQATVEISMRYRWTFVASSKQPKDGFVGTILDYWTLKNGTWYHLFRRPSPSKAMSLPAASKSQTDSATKQKPAAKQGQ